MDITAMFQVRTPVIGMVHLEPLPGAPSFNGDMESVRTRMKEDAQALVAGGVDGLIIENYGDAPYYPESVPGYVLSHMTVLANNLVNSFNLPVGVNVLRNDGKAALSVATAAGAGFVRINIHTGARHTDQGIISGKAHGTVRLREEVAPSVDIFADVSVKHSARIGDGTFDEEFRAAVERGHADAVIVSGPATGRELDQERLERAAHLNDGLNRNVPLLVGSGAQLSNIDALLPVADGVIVGTAFKENGQTTQPVARERVERFMKRVAKLRES